jgi:predicted regulator of Ras-like GTPase activity (Roadblock/LC7/MglB family)
MANLRELVTRVHATPGVTGAAAVGRDGLLIDAAGLDAGDADHVAALAPGLIAAAEMLSDAGAAGGVRRCWSKAPSAWCWRCRCRATSRSSPR